ncbi:MAG TPA: methyltransferase, TIGR04325 family [Chitinophagaceae bacterium]|nr:methyltransferase, TIGR04325 family [Chitinophagaceae bacterium]
MDKLVQLFKRTYLRIKYRRYGWKGDYKTWSEALANSTGYSSEAIVEKVKAATLLVKSGDAIYERDAMLFDHIEYSWPLMAHLLWIANNSRSLSIIDFGGSLGSSYFQNRHYLQQVADVKWSVVEQPGFVSAGSESIADDQLQFFNTVDEAITKRGMHQVLLLSCVLPYIERPYELLTQLAAKKFQYIIIDNTYFNPRPTNRLTVQKVPPVYYDAAYPAWFLHYHQVIATLAEAYTLINAYNNEQILYLDGQLLQYKGFVMQLKPQQVNHPSTFIPSP